MSERRSWLTDQELREVQAWLARHAEVDKLQKAKGNVHIMMRFTDDLLPRLLDEIVARRKPDFDKPVEVPSAPCPKCRAKGVARGDATYYECGSIWADDRFIQSHECGEREEKANG